MNNDFIERAKRKAQDLGKQLNETVEKQREQLSPQVHDALNQTQAQAEDALTELKGFVKKTAQSIRDDINKRP
ncbi:MAG TPA: hypothetical protein VIG32_05360 [Candidatus Baltobacteraceae bacterium]|jgi:gas vesicle protein